MDGISSEQPRSHFARSVVLLVILVFAVAAAAFLGGRLLWHSGPHAGEDDIAAFHGQLTMTMTTAGRVAPYTFDLDKAELIHGQRTSGGALLLEAVTASSTGDIAFRCDAKTGDQDVCIYSPGTGAHTVVSHNTHPLKRYLSWSPDEKSILYVAVLQASTTKLTSTDPNIWGVFLARADGSAETQIGVGSVAFFSPDGSAVYALEKDGLHKHELASGANTLAWPVTNGTASRFTAIALSKDGTQLAWSNPYSDADRGKVILFSVKSWEPLTLVSENELSMRAFQVQFSPDGAVLALSADSADGQPGLYAYVPGSEPTKVLDLGTYERRTLLSQWR